MYHIDTEDNDKWENNIHCAEPKCTHEKQYVGNTKTRLNWHHEIQNHYELRCPYFAGIAAHLPALNRRLRKQRPSFDYIKPNSLEVRNEICNIDA